MTSRWPGSCLNAVFSIKPLQTQNANFRVGFASHQAFIRQYAQQRTPKTTSIPNPKTFVATPEVDYAKTALVAVQSGQDIDPANPPRSARPPPLDLPTRNSETSTLTYYFRLGRAYGGFYKNGIKAVWFNGKAARMVTDRVKKEGGDVPGNIYSSAAMKGLITRAQYQLVVRNKSNMRKLPLFGLLVLIFGEWLPLLVPYIPSAVPTVCRIPKQVDGMRMKQQDRRRISFRSGVVEPSEKQLVDLPTSAQGSKEWPPMDDVAKKLVHKLEYDQLHHISASLNLHNRLWDRVGLSLPVFILRMKVEERLRYLAVDDKLMLDAGGAGKLNPDELDIACEERGLDVGRQHAALLDDLKLWLKKQENDGGKGRALVQMLFRRPNAWTMK